MKRIFLLILFTLTLPILSFAETSAKHITMTQSIEGILSLFIFLIAYALVMTEEFILLRKSKPVVLAAGIIWILVAIESNIIGIGDTVNSAIRHNILEYAELFLFLLVAMTYIATMEDRGVFNALRSWLLNRGFHFRQLFWITGLLTFVISPIADNLTTAMLMCAVVLAVAKNNPNFIVIACINIVVAANAGGAFSPFGDITTLMVWQKGRATFADFWHIFFPALISYIIPAIIMSFAVPKEKPTTENESVAILFGGRTIIILFLITITTTILMHHYLHLPPAIGMMTGFGYLMFYAYYLKRRDLKMEGREFHPFDIFKRVKAAEWDTLFFFYGVILCVGGLATFGYLSLTSDILYQQWGANLPAIHNATPANVIMGLLSAIVDNIPVMYGVLTMDPSMSLGQWLAVTLATGIGGSILSTGSAAGVALMGQSQGHYTFLKHLKWSWAIALGYIAGMWSHYWLNVGLLSIKP